MSIDDLKEYLLRKYDVEYDKEYKILYIHKPIRVNDLQRLKDYINDLEINDIRVEHRHSMVRW